MVTLFRTVTALLEGSIVSGISVCLNHVKVLKESVFFGISIALALALGKLDIIILRTLTNPVVVGNYSAAYVFLDACVIGLGVVRQALFPNLARLFSTSRKKYLELTVKSSAVLFLIGIVGTVAIILAAPFSLEIIGKSFDKAPELVRWLSLSLPFLSLSGALGGAVIAAGQAKSAVLIQAAGLLCNIAANYLLIPRYQAVGAACATFLTYFVTSVGYACIVMRFGKGSLRAETNITNRDGLNGV